MSMDIEIDCIHCAVNSDFSAALFSSVLTISHLKKEDLLIQLFLKSSLSQSITD
jgi:hypothetical protein